jgi:nitroreductase
MDTNLEKLIEKQLSWRYATKRFDPSKTIPQSTWHTLEEALRLAPSSFGLQPWKFIVVTDKKVREALQPHSWNQPQIVEASHLVVLAAKTEVGDSEVDGFINHISDVRGVPTTALADYSGMMKGFLKMLNEKSACEAWATHQVYLALGMLLSSASTLGVDACPLEGIDAAKYNEILKLSQTGYSAKVACALGYRSAEDQAASYKKVRYSREKVFQNA